MTLKTPEMPNNNDYDKTNTDGNSNSYNVDEESRDATSLQRRATSLPRH